MAEGSGNPANPGEGQGTVPGADLSALRSEFSQHLSNMKSNFDKQFAAQSRRQQEATDTLYQYEQKIRDLEEELEDTRSSTGTPGQVEYDLNGNQVVRNTSNRGDKEVRKMQRQLEELQDAADYYKRESNAMKSITTALARNAILPGDPNVDWAPEETDPDIIKDRVLASLPGAVRLRDASLARVRESAAAVTRKPVQERVEASETDEVSGGQGASPSGGAPAGFLERYERYLKGDKTAITRGEIEAFFKLATRKDKFGQSMLKESML